MANSDNNVTVVDPCLTIRSDKGFDKIVFMGQDDDLEIYLSAGLYHIACSDGTLLKYDVKHHMKISVIEKGSLFLRIEEDPKVVSAYVLFKDDIRWIVAGELDEF